MTSTTATKADLRRDLMILPGATLREGFDALGLAMVAPIRPVKGKDVEGDRERHHQHCDTSAAACICHEGGGCPKCFPRGYAADFAKHLGTEAGA